MKKNAIDFYVDNLGKDYVDNIDKYIDNPVYVDKIKLENKSGTVCSLEILVKADSSSEGGTFGESRFIDLGSSVELDLSDVGVPGDCYVTAYVKVKAGSDDQGNVWFRYKKGAKTQARYAVSGVINFTSVAFCELSAYE